MEFNNNIHDNESGDRDNFSDNGMPAPTLVRPGAVVDPTVDDVSLFPVSADAAAAAYALGFGRDDL